ncbi:MAG: bifunctional folylpolyglutamate synthase/dihydrofolate synthase [Candidatus Dormibacteria bacterium]
MEAPTRAVTSGESRPGSGPERLSSALARLDAAGRFGIVPGLERTRWLLDHVGNPHLGLRGVLVAGTNGKGSVAALLEAMARAAGRRTALLAKPHLVRWGERIVLDGEPMDDGRFAALAREVLDAADQAPSGEHPTQFEILTVMGFLAAARHRAGTVVCEVGMGGRLDSTNVADLGGCVVTNVALDHREWLGDTVEAIAAEKAGIVKTGDWVVTAATEPARSIITERARTVGAPLRVLEAGADWRGTSRGRAGVEVELDPVAVAAPRLHCRSPLCGRVQEENLAVAAATAVLLGIPEPAIVTGAASVRWPGRLQWIEGTPALLLDGAHNPAALAALQPEVAELAGGRRVIAVFGAMADKQLGEMLPLLPAMAGEVVLTSIGGERAASAAALAVMLPGGVVVEPVTAAVAEARRRAGPSGLVLVCGSLALVGRVLAQLDAG